MSSNQDFQEVGLKQWADRLQKELKSPLKFEDLQWQVSEYFNLDPLYDASIFEKENLDYLKAFHLRWAQKRESEKPEILAFADPVFQNDPSKIKEAESYNFQSWYSENGNSNQNALSVSARNFGKITIGSKSKSEYDPLMDGFATGQWINIEKEKVKINAIHIHAADIHHAGGSAVQELALALLCAEEYRKADVENKIWANQAVLHLGVGPLFWLELAKIRAMRLVFMSFCDINALEIKTGLIRTETSKLYWSKSDTELNLLRHSSEVLSAILGGADQVLVFPHTFEKNKALDSTRLAINIPLLALEESQLHSDFDPASGSYMLELLTHKLAKAAWELFSKWNEVGFEKLIKTNQLQEEILKSANELKIRFSEGKVQMVGVNAFKSPMAKTSPPFPFQKPIENPEFQPLVPVFLDA